MIKVICDVSETASNTNTPRFAGDRDFIDTAWLEEEDSDFDFGTRMDSSGRRVYDIFVDG